MAEEMISKERIDYTIDLLITMAVEEIAKDTRIPFRPITKDNGNIAGILFFQNRQGTLR